MSGIQRIEFAIHKWRSGRDSNPRCLSTYTLSRRAPSATRTPDRCEARILAHLFNCAIDFDENYLFLIDFLTLIPD